MMFLVVMVILAMAIFSWPSFHGESWAPFIVWVSIGIVVLIINRIWIL
jgi:hypothetical protein